MSEKLVSERKTIVRKDSVSEKFAPSHAPTFGPLVHFFWSFLHMCRVCRFDRKLHQSGFEKSRENESARRLNRVRFAASKASRLHIYTRVIFLSDISLSVHFFIFFSLHFSLSCVLVIVSLLPYIV